MKIKKEIIFDICGIGVACIGAVASFMAIFYGNQMKEYSSEKEVSYIIMDASVEYIEEDVIFTVTLPNGDKETFTSNIEDVPLNTSEVVIETSNIDDVSTYKIVGLR